MATHSRFLLDRYGPAALVTGASSGIGRAMAGLLASYGFDLVLVSRSACALDELAATLSTRHGIAAHVIATDLGDPGSLETVAGHEAVQRVGLLVAAAGFGSSGAFTTLPLDDELAIVDLNCRAVVALTHAMARHFERRQRGGIVLFGSLVGWQGTPYSATYAASKAFIQSFGEALAIELASDGVDVLVAAPGPVATGFAHRAGMVMGMTDEPDAVAADILAALGRKRGVTPGRAGRLLSAALRPLPRRLRIGIMGRIMKGMASRNGAAAA